MSILLTGFEPFDGASVNPSWEAVKKLPDKYKIPILLFYMEELSIADISGMLDLSEGTIKSRIHRAKKILKQKLEDVHYEK